MFNLFNRAPEIIEEEPAEVVINLRDIVEVNGRLGRVEMIALSPYWGEDAERAFVVSLEESGMDAWTDWCLPEEMVLVFPFIQATA